MKITKFLCRVEVEGRLVERNTEHSTIWKNVIFLYFSRFKNISGRVLPQHAQGPVFDAHHGTTKQK